MKSLKKEAKRLERKLKRKEKKTDKLNKKKEKLFNLMLKLLDEYRRTHSQKIAKKHHKTIKKLDKIREMWKAAYDISIDAWWTWFKAEAKYQGIPVGENPRQDAYDALEGIQ